MEFRAGDRVLVNLAPFIGSARRSSESIPCLVLDTDATHVVVRTNPPFRELSLRVLATWVEGIVENDDERKESDRNLGQAS